MANRYQTVTYTTAVVAAGATTASADTNKVITASLVNVNKIKITQDVGGGTFDAKLYKDSALTEGNRLATWLSVTPALYHPMDNATGTPAEATEGLPIPYDDVDSTANLHLQIKNNDSVGHAYTVTILYEEVPQFDATGVATLRGTVKLGGFTPGSVLFAGAGGAITQNNANLFWDNVGLKFGVRTAAPRALFDVTNGAANIPGDVVGSFIITGPSIDLGTDNSGTLTLQCNSLAGTDAGPVLAFGGRHLAASSQAVTFAQLKGAKENATSGDLGGYFAVATRATGANNTVERMRVNSVGNISIGTVSSNIQGSGSLPVLTIQGSSGGVIELSSSAADATAASQGSLSWATAAITGAEKRVAYINAVLSGTTIGNRGGYLSVYTKADGGTVSERIRFRSDAQIDLWPQASDTSATQYVLLLDMASPTVAGTRDSRFLQIRGASFDTLAHSSDWRQLVSVTSNAGTSTWKLQSRIDAAAFGDRFTVSDAGLLTVTDLQLAAGITVANVGGIINTVNVDTTITATAAEQTIYSYTVPANTMGTNRRLRLKLFAKMTTSATPPATIQIRSKYGTAVITPTATGLASSVTDGLVILEFEVEAKSATAQRLESTQESTQPPPNDGLVVIVGGRRTIRGTGAVDSTLAQTLSITIQFSAVDAGTSFTTEYATLEYLK